MIDDQGILAAMYGCLADTSNDCFGPEMQRDDARARILETAAFSRTVVGAAEGHSLTAPLVNGRRAAGTTGFCGSSSGCGGGRETNRPDHSKR